jgi:hypothetical protein
MITSGYNDNNYYNKYNNTNILTSQGNINLINKNNNNPDINNFNFFGYMKKYYFEGTSNLNNNYLFNTIITKGDLRINSPKEKNDLFLNFDSKKNLSKKFNKNKLWNSLDNTNNNKIAIRKNSEIYLSPIRKSKNFDVISPTPKKFINKVEM